jgi:hydroxypyruvate reductase
VLALMSGGGSALLAAPAGRDAGGEAGAHSALLRSGAIGEINCVRKHLSAIKGGRLAAAAWPAAVLTLAISDVPGDDPAVIASGPTVPDPTTAPMRWPSSTLPDRSAGQAARAAAIGELETPKPGDPRLTASDYRLVASPRQMLEARRPNAAPGHRTAHPR